MKQFVICSSSREYFDYLKSRGKSPRDNVYLHDITQLFGLSEVHGVFCGTYRDRPDLQQIVQQIRLINRIPAYCWVIPPSDTRPTPRKPK